MALLGFVLQGELRKKLEEESYKQVEANGNTIVAELIRQTAVVNTLAENLAASIDVLPFSETRYHQLLPRLINSSNAKALIAGGGIWPEPHALQEDTIRGSFFWGKNRQGKLTFYDDYNLAQGAGYHNEEWYVPARYLSPGRCYWSRSYTDPYSKEPMVTCTVAMMKDQQYIGASTIDMKLAGLQGFFETKAQAIGGYVFLVDQNNKFISYPDDTVIKQTDSLDNIDIEVLAIRQPAFKSMASHLGNLTAAARETDIETREKRSVMSSYFEKASYQVSKKQADIMAAAILDPMANQIGSSYLLQSFQLEQDMLLKERVNVSVFHVPESYWKLVLVTPTSTDFEAVSGIITRTSKQIVVPTLLIMALCFLFIHRSFVIPLNRISNHLKEHADNPEDEHILEDFGSGDFGRLAERYNQKTALVKKSLAELSRSNSQLKIYASYDVLTGIYNRRAFEGLLDDVLQGADKNTRAVFFLDLDQFKVINDTAGHAAGDQLLKQVSKHIANTLRDDDILARFGGDEFAMIISASTIEIALAVADRIRQVICALRFVWDENTYSISCSIGILHLSTLEGDQQIILSCVDSACYAAKDAGRNRIHLYLPEDNKLALRTGEMQSLISLRKAIDEDRLFIEYQLIKHIEGDEPSGVEALIRMKDDQGNTVYPGKFMPAAEHYNASWQIDSWVIGQAIKEFSQLRKCLDLSFCAINLTADALNHDQLLDVIKKALLTNNIAGSAFSFEVTETTAIANIDLACKTIEGIQLLGCRIALDDFGTGMSSYGYLRDLPIDYLKIDGTFVKNIVTNPVDYAFVKSIKDIAEAMHIKTVAEWVEDEATLSCLKEIGVSYGQGFGISKPAPYQYFIDNHDDFNSLINRPVSDSESHKTIQTT